MNSTLLSLSAKLLISASLSIAPLAAAENLSKSVKHFDLDSANSSAVHDLNTSQKSGASKEDDSKSLTVSAAAQAEGIKQKIISEHAAGDQYRKSIEIHDSVYTNRISFIRQPDKNEIVIKYYRNDETGRKGYQKDIKSLESDNEVIAKYNEGKEKFLKINPHEKLPILTKILGFSAINYKDSTVYVEYMEAAKGKTIQEYIDEAKTVDADVNLLKEVFTHIGKQFGNIHKMLNMQNHNNPEPNHLVHPDPNPGNFMYDRTHDQLYWIDLSDLKFEQYSETNGFKRLTEINLLFFTKGIPEMIGKLIDICKKITSETDKVNFFKKITNLIHIHQAFFMGYKESVDKYMEKPLTIEFVFLQNEKQYSGDYSFSIRNQTSKNLKYEDFKKLIGEVNTLFSQINNHTIDFLEGYRAS